MLFVMQSCYNYRNTGLLQTNNKSLPEYEKVEYTPYRLRVNDELIYRLITTDETLAKVIAGNSSSSLTYVNSYRVNDDGTVDLPFLDSIPVLMIRGCQRDAGFAGLAFAGFSALFSRSRVTFRMRSVPVTSRSPMVSHPSKFSGMVTILVSVVQSNVPLRSRFFPNSVDFPPTRPQRKKRTP